MHVDEAHYMRRAMLVLHGLGPQRTKIHRYLLVIFLAKSAQMFRLSGNEIDNSIYFTLYALKEIANSFKDISPYHLPIIYDRSKVATKVYNMISNDGLVDIKKIDGFNFNQNLTKIQRNYCKSNQVLCLSFISFILDCHIQA
jgi:hypothetical protein